MISLSSSHPTTSSVEGPRPVNLRTDLSPLADLIEVAFASSMDNSGRAAVREMRAMSRMPGLGLLSGANSLMHGLGLGYVWIAGGRLVGNVSTYPAAGIGFDGKTWVIVNVATHPSYQRRGIAEHLMRASLEMIAQRGGEHVLLQVDADNAVAQRLYERLGFVAERAWTTWRRGGAYTTPPPFEREPRLHITRRRPDEWAAEYRLAEQVRPDHLGGLGWLRPLHERHFRSSLWQGFRDWISFRRCERLIIRSADGSDILASMWVETSLNHSTHLTLMVQPDYEGSYDEALINTVVRRYGSGALSLEHPSAAAATSAVLRRYQFVVRREVVHMRWPAGH